MSKRSTVLLLVLLIFLLSLALRAYYTDLWGDVPTSDPYHFVGWANGIESTSHLTFPGSEDGAYGQYPDGYPMILHMLASTTGASVLILTKYLPVLLGALCVFPVYLAFRRLTDNPLYCAVGSASVVFSLAFIKYTSVSIPNLPGLYLFALGVWAALGAGWRSKRLILILVMLLIAVAEIHYLSLVCVGVLLALVVSRRVIITATGGANFDPRRLAFLLIVALVAGVVAWTAAYRVMRSVYGIDITMQPPPRLSIVLKPLGYPLIFGIAQTLALPVGLFGLARAYYADNFGRGQRKALMDPLLLLSIWLVFFIFAVGFMKVEYYPFRFNTFLMIPLGMISLLGVLLIKDYLGKMRYTAFLASIALPAFVFLAAIQPIVVSRVPVSGGEPFLPWKQEYGQTEMTVLSSWMQDNTLLTTVNRSTGLPRRQMIMADWVRSRAMKAFGSEDVHLHWWFFQGWSDLDGKPFVLRSLDVYGGDIEKALQILGRLNLRLATGSTGEWVYYYKYIYASDWIADIMEADFGLVADFSKFDTYNGSMLYRLENDDYAGDLDQVLLRKDAGRPTWVQSDFLLRPLDRLYNCPGVSVYYFNPLYSI